MKFTALSLASVLATASAFGVVVSVIEFESDFLVISVLTYAFVLILCRSQAPLVLQLL